MTTLPKKRPVLIGLSNVDRTTDDVDEIWYYFPTSFVAYQVAAWR